MQLQYINQYAEICKFTQYRNSIRTNTHIYANGIRTDTHDKWFTQSVRMIRNQYANDNMQIYSIAIHKSISRDTQSYTQYSNSIHTNMHIYANGIYAHIRRIYANVLRSQYAWYAINTQMIYTDICNCNTQYAYIRNLRNTVILYAPIRIFTQMVYTHRYAGYTQMFYAVNTHNTQSIRKWYTQIYAIAIRNTHIYAIYAIP